MQQKRKIADSETKWLVRADSETGDPHTLKRQLVREEILRGAAKLFADRGVRDVRIDDVGNSLGYTKSSVYYYIVRVSTKLPTPLSGCLPCGFRGAKRAR